MSVNVNSPAIETLTDAQLLEEFQLMHEADGFISDESAWAYTLDALREETRNRFGTERLNEIVTEWDYS